MEEVWEVLDFAFAQEQEVGNTAYVDLNNLVLFECSIAQYIMKLRNYLPNLEGTLTSVNGLTLSKLSLQS